MLVFGDIGLALIGCVSYLSLYLSWLLASCPTDVSCVRL